jgi:hypothetical protein
MYGDLAMKKIRLLGMGCAFVIASVSSTLSMAAVIGSVDRATFQAAIAGGTIGGENFDSLAVGTILGVGAIIDLTYSASGGSPIVTNSFNTSTSPNGLGSTSFGFFLDTETATFSFSTPISAFAIDINTFASADGAYTASLDIGDTVTSIFEVFPNSSTGQFIGFVSNVAFTGVTIASSQGFTYTLDTLVYGDASSVVHAPVPAAVWLFGSGLLGLIGMARRKKA